MTTVAEWLKGLFKDNFSGLVNGVSNAYGVWQSGQNTKASIDAQKSENQLTREYNRELAAWQNEQNIAQWQRENAYNDPSAQRARLESAGLNADLMYGGSGVMNTAAHSPAMVSGAPATPVDWSSLANVPTYGNVVNSYLDAQLKQAQINKLNEETTGQGIQNKILTSDADFRQAYNQGQLDTMYSTIKLQGSQVDLNNAQIKKTQSELMQIDALTQQIYANTQKIYNDISVSNARLDMDKLLNDAQVKQAYEQANLTRQQAQRLINEWDYMLRNYNDVHELNLSQTAKLKQEKDNMKFEADMKYGDRDRSMSAYLQTLKFLNQVTTYALPFVKK